MTKPLVTIETDDNRGKATISISKEIFVVDYYDDNNRHFFFEEFENKTIYDVRDQVEKWARGIRKLEDSI